MKAQSKELHPRKEQQQKRINPLSLDKKKTVYLYCDYNQSKDNS